MTAVRHAPIYRDAGESVIPDELALLCPHCRKFAGTVSRTLPPERAEIICPFCVHTIKVRGGIVNALSPEREAYFAEFIRNYESIRSAEGRGSENPDFYLALPDQDLSGRNTEQWKIRRCTYECLVADVLGSVGERSGRGLDVLDLGAGNCWLSYRLALRGHRPVAVDLLDNDFDGLGAAKHYRSRVPGLFPRVRAEFDALPFADGAFDVVIFNASFHYSEHCDKTVAESLRCLRRPGWLVIADTAWYSDEKSGEAMLQERARAFLARFGTASESLTSLEFLTDARLQSLEQQFGLLWKRFEPGYGVRWRMRPLIAKLRRRREPSRFRIYVAEVSG